MQLKKKELLQKSSTVAAVVLAAALMDPSAVQASASDSSVLSSSAQVLEESVSTESSVSEISENDPETPATSDTDDETDSVSQDTSVPDSVTISESEDSSASELPENTNSTITSEENTSDEISSEVSDTSSVETVSDDTTSTDSSQNTITPPGWSTDSDGNVSYVDENGSYIQNEIKEIDGKKYYLDENCHLVKNSEFTYYISELTSKVLRAQEDGTLLINSWYGNNYFDENGYKCLNCSKIIGDFGYEFDFSGNATMYQNTIFYVKDENYNSSAYFAQKDGALLKNNWRILQPSYSYSYHTYYFGNDGKGYEGLHTIDGKLYYFKTGELIEDQIITLDEKTYICGSDGVVVEANSNGWTFADGNYYYAQKGVFLKNCVEKIGKFYYGFDSYGQMYANTTFYLNDNYYEAHSDGSLYQNAWSNRYGTPYYGDDCIAYMGLHTINGKLYYFDSSHQLLKSDSITVDNKEYFADANGILSDTAPILYEKNGWFAEGNSWYYVKDHDLLKGCIEKIGTHYFAFDSKGRMRCNEIFHMWVEVETESGTTMSDNYYYADHNGYLQKNVWGSTAIPHSDYSDPNAIYYFGENYAAYIGLHEVNGTLYYFTPSLATDRTITVNGKKYLCCQDGSLVEFNENGWIFSEDNSYYVKDGKLLTNCVVQIDSDYYGFDSDGRMYNNTKFSLYDEEFGTQTYFAQKGGKLIKNKSLTISGESYYFGSDYKALTGIQNIGGKQYYYENGYLQKNCALKINDQNYIAGKDGDLLKVTGNDQWFSKDGSWYYVQDFEFLSDIKAKIGDHYYLFSETGRRYQDNSSVYFNGNYYSVNKDGILKTNAWGFSNGNKFYYTEDGTLATGLYEIDGNYYLFKEYDGFLICNGAQKIGNKIFVSDSYGHAVRLKHGWTKFDGYWYYVTGENTLASFGIYTIGNYQYAFGKYGRMYTDTVFTQGYWSSSRNEYIYVTYLVDSQGRLTPNRTLDLSDGRYSQDSAGDSYNGMKTIDNVKYYFIDGKMQKDSAYMYQGKNYVSGSDGRVLVLPYNGWTEVDGHWYLVSNGTIIKDGIFTKGNATYLFNSDGAMVTNGISFSKTGCYLANGSGIIRKNTWWKTADGNWMYFGNDGKAVNGRHVINGKNYRFEDFEVKTHKVSVWNGKNYITDSNGLLREVTSDGWTKLDGFWYYFIDGSAVKDNIISIGTSLYGFDSNGRMYDNQEFTRSFARSEYDENPLTFYYRAAAGGKLIVNGSYQANGTIYYYNADGIGINGYQKVNGVTWFFINGKQQKNASFCDFDGNYYIADFKGTLSTLESNKWKQVNGFYYYVKDGTVLKDTVALINGSYYGFDANGRMYSNQTFTDASGNTYHASASGALLRNRWYSDSTGKYYFDARGIGFEGVHLIDGERYTFAHGKVSYKPAWQKDSKGWWYRHADGSYTKNDWEKINGKYYYFNGSGYMVTGWQKLNGKWYYFEADGSMAGKGWHKIGGKWYYMYESGAMATNTWIGDNYVDADGVWKN